MVHYKNKLLSYRESYRDNLGLCLDIISYFSHNVITYAE